MRLPEGFSCSDSAIPQLAVRKEKGATVYSFDLSKLPVTASANAAVRKEFMIRSRFSASGKLYPVSFRTVDGPHVSPWKTVSFRILPRSVNKAPKRFRSGLYLTHQHMLPKEQSRLDFFKDYADAGFNFIQGWFPYKGESGKYLKQRKVIRSYENWFLSNAYHLGQAPKPENAKFRLADGKAFIGKGIRYYSICPSEVIEEGPYYRSEIKKILVDPLTVEDSCDTMMVNHEPFAYNGKGCFCARCREAFIKYLKSEKVKFDAAQFRKSWPGSASAYSEKFIRFCSLRHAETVRVYNKTAAEAGKRAGKISAYIPEINWVELEKQSVDLFRYYSALDYMRDLPVLQPWGPYLFHDLNEEYIYTPGYHLITWGAARAVKEFLKENISVPSQIPQLYAFPHGNQSGSWFTEPEAIVFDSLCFFLNKWEGSVVYIYNMLDYKYFAALSDMNGLIARYEDFIFDGKERRGDRAESVTPMIGQAEFRPWLNGDNVEGFLCLRPEKMGSYIGPENALRLKSFSLGSKILAVAGNFWQRGESFFNLKLKDLKPGSRYTVRQPHAKRSFGTFSGAELMKKGILLHAGALRFAFYTVEEGQLSVPGETFISQTQLKQLMNKRLPVIKKAFAAERTKARNWEKNFASIMNEEKAAVAGKRFDFSVLPSVSNAGVQLAPSGTTVMVTNAVYSLKFHPQKGGIITDLNVKGVRLDTPAPNFGIAMDTLFGAGGVNIDRPMRLESVEPVKDGVKAVLVRKLTMRDNKRYQGITLRKTYVFTSKGFTTTSEFCNDTPAKISLTVRQHNFAPNGTKDAFLTAGQKKFPRDMKHKVLRINNKADKIIKSLKMPVFDIDRAKLIFATSGTPAYVSVTPGKTQPSFILIWENGKSYTAEYIFPETNISPGEKFSYQTTWQIIPVPLR